jgi:hypothetical protein
MAKSNSKNGSNNQSGLYVTSAMRSPKNNTTRDIGYSKGRTTKQWGGARGAPPQPTVRTWNVPVYPAPQPIKNMPPQFAGYTDYARAEETLYTYGSLGQNTEGTKINTAGQVARGIEVENEKSAKDFFNTKSVFVNPAFKDKYDKVGNDPDSADRSRGPLVLSEERLQTLRAMSAGVNQWAKATSAYFGKPFEVGVSPNYSRASTVGTTNVNIFGDEAGDRYSGMVIGSGSYTPGSKKVLKSPLGENRITPRKALIKEMYLNTDISANVYSGDEWASTVQHEFGHTMGLGHPHNDPKGTTLNSEMSYDARGEGATILPATINAYRNAMGLNAQYEAAKKAAAKNKSTNKKTKRR